MTTVTGFSQLVSRVGAPKVQRCDEDIAADNIVVSVTWRPRASSDWWDDFRTAIVRAGVKIRYPLDAAEGREAVAFNGTVQSLETVVAAVDDAIAAANIREYRRREDYVTEDDLNDRAANLTAAESSAPGVIQ